MIPAELSGAATPSLCVWVRRLHLFLVVVLRLQITSMCQGASLQSNHQKEQAQAWRAQPASPGTGWGPRISTRDPAPSTTPAQGPPPAVLQPARQEHRALLLLDAGSLVPVAGPLNWGALAKGRAHLMENSDNNHIYVMNVVHVAEPLVQLAHQVHVGPDVRPGGHGPLRRVRPMRRDREVAPGLQQAKMFHQALHPTWVGNCRRSCFDGVCCKSRAKTAGSWVRRLTCRVVVGKHVADAQRPCREHPLLLEAGVRPLHSLGGSERNGGTGSFPAGGMVEGKAVPEPEGPPDQLLWSQAPSYWGNHSPGSAECRRMAKACCCFPLPQGSTSSPFTVSPRRPLRAAGCWRRSAAGGSLHGGIEATAHLLHQPESTVGALLLWQLEHCPASDTRISERGFTRRFAQEVSL